jgi:hypothetical protein
VGGSTEARIARLPGIRIGSFDISLPVVTLGVTQSRGLRSDSSGRIGGEILRRFTVAINYRARRMTLVPKRESSRTVRGRHERD